MCICTQCKSDLVWTQVHCNLCLCCCFYRLIQKPNCVKVPKEVCVNAKSNPRKVGKTVLNPINSAAAIYGLSPLIHFSSFIYAAFGPFLVHCYTPKTETRVSRGRVNTLLENLTDDAFALLFVTKFSIISLYLMKLYVTCFAIASSVIYREIRQNLSNSAYCSWGAGE